ncbi:MAG: methyltransferase domain-containing protein [Salinisphaera sp.]|nr:methyltransferase domain-containing protein [Salinisphaera sp.]
MTSPLSELAQATAHRARVARYYRRTQWQYYGLWSGRKTLALHYGYWDTGVRSHPQALLRLNQVLAERVGIRAGDRVLDAGCGWGGSSIWLAREKAAACTGVTLERHQARIGANMARRRGVRADFARADFTALPFEDASFDVVWAVESVCHAPDKTAFLRQAARVLAPGGRLILADFFLADDQANDEAAQRVADWVKLWAVPALAGLDAFAASVRAAGFTEVDMRDETDAIRPAARRLYRIGLWTAPVALLFRLLRIHDQHAQGNWLSSLRQYRALRAGGWRYGIVSARKPVER